MQFQISSRRENRQRDTRVIKIRVQRKIFSNFALSDAEDNTSGPLNRGGIADLPLLRTLLAIRQKYKDIHKDIFACLFSIHNTISLSCHEQVCLSGLRLFREILLPSSGNVNDYVAHI